MTKYKENISHRYPYITLIRVLSTLNYKSGIVRDWNNEKLTIHSIEHILGMDSREMNQSLDVLAPLGIMSELVDVKTKKRYLVVDDLIIKTIEKSKINKSKLNQDIDKNIFQ